MRDPNNTVQRRRRLRLLQVDSTENPGGIPVESMSSSNEETSNSLGGDEAALSQLFQECQGLTGLTLLVEVVGEAHARKISLDRPLLLIGHDSQCDVVINHPAVGPRCAYLQWIDGRVFACGLGSTGQKPVAAWVGRKPVSIGPLRISIPNVEAQADPADPQARNPELAEELPQVQLKFAGVEQRDNLWPVDRPLALIGRGPQCKLRLDHPEIPFVMAALLRTPVGCWLLNLSGDSALRINDRSVNVDALEIGDTIQLGPFHAEVSVAPFIPEPSKPAPLEPETTVHELAVQHRQRLGALNQSLSAVQVYLDSDHLDGIPELKLALQQYVLHAQRHHREIQEALDQLSSH